MIKRILLLCLFPNLLFAQNLAEFVNPFIGTGGHGHTFPGATAPFGFCQLSPDTRIDGSWDGCGGYHYSDSVIYGFSHTHLSGTGVSDYGDILLMPVTRKMRLDNYDYKSTFLHKSEKAQAGYYRVFLEQARIGVELTTSRRCGFHKYTFKPNDETYVVLDLAHRDELLESRMDMVDKHTIRGYRYSKAWATKQKVFFEIKFEQEIERILYEPQEMGSTTQAISLQKSPRALVKLKKQIRDSNHLNAYQIVKMKVGLSGVDMEGAKKNLKAEIPHWDFDKTKKWVQDEWNKELSKIKVADNEENYGFSKYTIIEEREKAKNKKIIFYTALYHCMIAPNIYSDVDHRYRGRDDKIHSTEGKFDYYTVFSLWDTYRALHPLLTIIDKKRTNDFINTFIRQYEEGGRLPVWELSSNETNCMIGYHAVSVIWDAYNKGIRNYDAEKAFEAMKSIATEDTEALKSYMRYGYVRAEDDHESVSKTLEYAYDDWCIAQMAKALGKEEDYKYFEKRSHNWINVYDPTTGFMRARKNSTLIEPFSPYLVDNNYTEANSWQYSFYVPHEDYWLFSLLSQQKKEYNGIVSKLDDLFNANSQTEGRTQADITGLIGQYAHGNEPSHQIPYLYYRYNNRQKGDKIVQQIMKEFYSNTPAGYIGNEDCGQMSAWYVFNSMGFYPYCPGAKYYTNAVKQFDTCILNNKTQIVEANMRELSFDKKKNGDILSFTSVTHEDLITKGECTLYTGYRRHAPPSLIYKNSTIPFLNQGKQLFEEKIMVELLSNNKEEEIYYSMNGEKYKEYLKPLEISENITLDFKTHLKRKNSFAPVQTATFTKLPDDKEVFLNSKYGKTYHAGGPMGLVDGIRGKKNWRAGDWQGYQGQDFEAVVKYSGENEIAKLTVSFLQDQRAWIFFPTEVSFYESADSANWNLVETVSLSHKQKRDEDIISLYEVSTSKRLNGSTTKHYYRVVAKNYGLLPKWHPGAGNPAYIFIDEIELD